MVYRYGAPQSCHLLTGASSGLPAALHEVAVVAAPVLEAVQPGVGFGLELAGGSEAATVEGGAPALRRAVPWKRSHTALWFGLRGGMR